jgi:hypothetical protein
MLGAARAQSSQGVRTFRLLLKDNGAHAATQIQDAFASDGNIYYLARESAEVDSVYKIGCTSATGDMIWRRRLPYGLYRGIGMSENGDLLLLAITSNRHKDDPVDSVYSVVPGDSNPPQLTWLSAVPSAGEVIGSVPFLKGSHFGSVSNGVSLSMTTMGDLLQHHAPTTCALSGPPLRSFDILEYGGSLLTLNKEAAEVGVCGSANVPYSRIPISGTALSAARAALETVNAGLAVPTNTAVNLIAASGVVGGSLHLLILPFMKGVVTYGWCDPTFTVSGTTAIDVSLLPRAVSLGILQLGTEAALVFSDGSVVAFPIRS